MYKFNILFTLFTLFIVGLVSCVSAATPPVRHTPLMQMRDVPS